MTKFVRRVINGEKVPFKCPYKCLRTCEPTAVPYCIARALCNAANGDLDNAVVFAGSNVARVNKIVSVKELIDELTGDAIAELGK
jgi:nitronate monooxygenase